MIKSIIDNTNELLLFIPLALLSLDTIRALLAMTGWVKPTSKIAWIIYGRYERNLIISALKDLGYGDKSEQILRENRKSAQKHMTYFGINKQNAHYRLICLLIKYLKCFGAPVQCGASKSTHSQYYIDTMEASHNNEDLRDLACIFNILISKHIQPQIIIVPKNGNPLLGQAVADLFEAKLLIAKAQSDNSRILMSTGITKEDYLNVNYEGSWSLKNRKNQKCILLDCNATTGSQLLDILKDIRKCELDIKPAMAFTLFRIDNDDYNIDKAFEDLFCPLHRFFDVDEHVREQLYTIQTECDSSHQVSHYNIADKGKIDNLIVELKKKNKYWYDYDTIDF